MMIALMNLLNNKWKLKSLKNNQKFSLFKKNQIVMIQTQVKPTLKIQLNYNKSQHNYKNNSKDRNNKLNKLKNKVNNHKKKRLKILANKYKTWMTKIPQMIVVMNLVIKWS